MKFCSYCGDPVVLRIPPGDNRERFVCSACEVIHYHNPRIIVGCVPTFEDKVLLCRRAIEPRKNFWTLPAGFMENDETTAQGAARESYEEALADVSNLTLYCLYSVPEINQVFFFYRCNLTHATAFGVGEESLESRLFTEDDLPWDNIAFYTVYKTLRYYFADRKNNHYPIRDETLERPDSYKTPPIKPQISTR